MSELRPLRGGCQCGRNRYIIAVPRDAVDKAQVLFNTEPLHQIPLATPLAAYIRVPLAWFHSTTFAFFPDETHPMIRRVYTHPGQEHSKRHFCGFCGTPLSYWSESPRPEADFINLTLGSLLREDLRDLEDMGLIPEDDDDDDDEAQPRDPQDPTPRHAPVSPAPTRSTALRQSFGVPWFDGLVEGTRLGNMRRAQGVKPSRDGTVRVEWEIVEFAAAAAAASASASDAEMDTGSAPGSGKRKMQDRED